MRAFNHILVILGVMFLLLQITQPMQKRISDLEIQVLKLEQEQDRQVLNNADLQNQLETFTDRFNRFAKGYENLQLKK